MPRLDDGKRLQFATQRLIDIKWWLVELSKHAQDRYSRAQLTLLAGDLRKDIDNLLSDGDFSCDMESNISSVKLPGGK